MSRIPVHPHAVLHAAVLIAALLATACSDSTSPSAETSAPGKSAEASKPASAPAPEGQQAVATTSKPSFLVSTGAPTHYHGYYDQDPGVVTYSPPNVGAVDLGAVAPKSISVGGLKVGFLPGIKQIVQLSATFDASLCRWNGSSWVTVATKRATSLFPYGIRGSVIMPRINFLTQVPGYYTVTVKVTWWVTFLYEPVISQNFWFNAASDYAYAGKVGPGWVYLP